jgi:tetratricopeptide (TPR) repeat protein
VSSAEFSGADRLSGVLTYVVEEALAGRSAGIRAKTIGMDVYGYSADEIEAREGTVRVDAGRLRRKLEAFYGAEETAEPVVISIPKGTYAPTFAASDISEAGDPSSSESSGSGFGPRAFLLAAGGGLAGIILASAVFIGPPFGRLQAEDQSVQNHERSAIFDLAPGRLQALNLARDGRDMIFPAVDPRRLDAALILFEGAIEADPDYFGGYAGAAQVEATRDLLGEESALERASQLADKAMRLAPDDPWSMSAKAWTSFAEGQRSFAARLSERALDIAPSDPHIAEFDTLISLYSGKFERVAKTVERLQNDNGDAKGYVFDNAKASAMFHTGDFAGSIETFEAAIAEGAPYGPVTVSYLVAAHRQLGQIDDARVLADLYAEHWDGFRIDLLWARLFDDPVHIDALITGVQDGQPRKQSNHALELR